MLILWFKWWIDLFKVDLEAIDTERESERESLLFIFYAKMKPSLTL